MIKFDGCLSRVLTYFDFDPDSTDLHENVTAVHHVLLYAFLLLMAITAVFVCVVGFLVNCADFTPIYYPKAFAVCL